MNCSRPTTAAKRWNIRETNVKGNPHQARPGDVESRNGACAPTVPPRASIWSTGRDRDGHRWRPSRWIWARVSRNNRRAPPNSPVTPCRSGCITSNNVSRCKATGHGPRSSNHYGPAGARAAKLNGLTLQSKVCCCRTRRNSFWTSLTRSNHVDTAPGIGMLGLLPHEREEGRRRTQTRWSQSAPAAYPRHDRV